MKYAVTGGAGFIGRYLIKLLLDLDHQVTVIDNLHNSSLNNIRDIFDKIEFHNVDILQKDQVCSILKSQDGIFHQAALINVQESIKNPTLYEAVNVNGTRNIFEVASKFGIKVVFASSASIYGNPTTIPIKESFYKNPLSPYGKSKLICEQTAMTFQNSGSSIIGLRYFNVFGVGQSSDYAGVITKFLNSVLVSKPLEIFGSGKQIRDFVYVKDVALANLRAMESNTNSGFFNIGSGKVCSILDIANIIKKSFHSDVPILYFPARNGDILQSHADISLAKKFLKWKPTTYLNSWIKNKSIKLIQ